jgi:Golgi phosphoprotein 3 (GPP34)
MLIAEDLLLLATDDATGRSAMSTMQLDPALAGAVLIELVLSRRLDLQGEGRAAELVVIDETPLGDPVLDPALQILLDKGPMKPETAIWRLGKGLRERLHTSLESDGTLRRESAKVLGIFPTTRWPARDSADEDDLRQRITGALLLGQEPEPKVALIISVLTAADLLGMVVEKPDLKAAKARGTVIAEGNWASDSVRTVIQQAQAAVMTAVMVSTTVAITAGSN